MKYTNTQEIITYLKQLKLKKKLTNTDISKKMNCPSNTVASLFTQKNISLDKLNEICKAMDCELEINIIEK